MIIKTKYNFNFSKFWGCNVVVCLIHKVDFCYFMFIVRHFNEMMDINMNKIISEKMEYEFKILR